MTLPSCRLCGESLVNPAAHVPTPELQAKDERAFFCIESQRHVVLRPSWREDVANSLRSLRAGLVTRGGLR